MKITAQVKSARIADESIANQAKVLFLRGLRNVEGAR